MAKDSAVTSVAVNFEDSGYRILMEEASKPGSAAFKYFRVHTALPRDEYALTTSSGSAVCYLVDQKKVAKQYVTFQDSAEVALKYPAPSNVRFEVIGNLITDSQETPTLSVDTINGVIRSTEKCYGVVKVIFDAPYAMWKANFEGSQEGQGASTINQTANKDTEDDNDVAAAPMLILATAYGKVRNTISLSPLANSGDRTPEASAGARKPTVICEIDQKYPPQLRTGGLYNQGPKIAMGCRVRVYPTGSGDVTVTSGSITKLPDFNTMPYSDSLSFNGSAIASLKYQAFMGMITSSSLGLVTDLWGNSFLPTVVAPGNMVTAVTWLGQNTYSDPKTYQLGPQEVAITSGGILMPCYTGLLVEYTATYDLYEYVFAAITSGPYDDIVGFKSAALTAIRGVGDTAKIGAGSLNLEPKSSRGK